jgi:hypothetical protein
MAIGKGVFHGNISFKWNKSIAMLDYRRVPWFPVETQMSSASWFIGIALMERDHPPYSIILDQYNPCNLQDYIRYKFNIV